MTQLYFTVDAARFFLFHPKDFEELEDEFMEGEVDPPDIAFADSLVAGLHLGADGHRGVQLVVREPTDEETAHITGPIVFPLRVNHGRLFVTDRMASVDDLEWHDEPGFELDGGLYEVRWYRADEELQSDRNINWLVCFREVDSLEGLPEWRDFPNEDRFDIDF